MLISLLKMTEIVVNLEADVVKTKREVKFVNPEFSAKVKINELFNGFGLQKVAPPQQKESEKVAGTSPTAAQPIAQPTALKSTTEPSAGGQK